MNTPMMDHVLHADANGLVWLNSRKDIATLAGEIRALRADRDHYKEQAEGYKSLVEGYKSLVEEWKARAEAAERALPGGTTPPRRLRPYKGVTYREGVFVDASGDDWEFAASVIANNLGTFTDADHAALLALRDDPYEPVETLEDVVDKWWEELVGSAVDVPALCTRLRAHLSQQTPPLTAGEHIAALVAVGAELTTLGGAWALHPGSMKDTHVLVLPPEVSP